MFREMSAMRLRSHMTFEESEQILLESDLPQIDLCHKFHSRKAALKVRAMSFSGREVAELATKLR